MYNPLDNKKLNLAEQFRRFAAHSKKQKESGAYDQPVYTGVEESQISKHFEIELQRINEGGVR